MLGSGATSTTMRRIESDSIPASVSGVSSSNAATA
jgi:hypothetical protein